MSKNGRFRSFFSALGCHLARKSLSWPAMPVSNKKQEYEQRKRIKTFDDFWVRAYRFDFAPNRQPRARSMQTVDILAFNFRNCSRTAWLLASSFLLRFCYGFFVYILSSSMQGLKYLATDFLISTCEKVMLRQNRPFIVKESFWRFFIYMSTSRAKLKIL